ncbi:hypothetical protein LCGC14_0391780 [marine sediment metagenome]|uniref:Uncharacterized protein n=1 Tax=marine sediment metagenome TaxID=412755 RepID=A0A0F9THL0_9ZZZZ
MTGRAVQFQVDGKPVPQGSMRAFLVKGRPVITSSNPNLKEWRNIVAFQAQGASDGRPLEGPVGVTAAFRLPRPKSRPKKDRYPDRRPDLDKLVRALLDGMTGPVFADDSQVCMIEVRKSYALDESAGVVVRVWELADSE